MTTNINSLFSDENAVIFFGKITASFTHDLNNIIAIIDQSAGLMEDLLPGVAGNSGIPAKKFAAIAEKIRKHTSRGMALIKHLNTFSHGIDHPIDTVNLNDIITNLMALSGRFLSNKGIELELNLSEQDNELRSNPFVIQQILFMIIEIASANAHKGDKLTISTAVESDNAKVTLNFNLTEKTSQMDFDVVSKLAVSINAVLDVTLENGNVAACLLISDLKSGYNK
jgi:C4-dicarboxylate-specific signal transduction histidine kinase